MKKLFLVRHAKSSWKHPHLGDHDRPLNARGMTDAPMIGDRLRAKGVMPDAVISSSAVRARSTAKALADAIGFAADRIEVSGEIYETSAASLLEFIAALDDQWETVMIVGHNPTMTEAVNRVTGAGLENVPTGGIVEVTFAARTWRETSGTVGTMVSFDYPKRAS